MKCFHTIFKPNSNHTHPPRTSIQSKPWKAAMSYRVRKGKRNIQFKEMKNVTKNYILYDSKFYSCGKT
jgi:hypothetical protein